jgi:hypothetical protein
MFEAERSRSPGLPIGNIPALMTQIQILTINIPRHLGILLKRPYTDRAKKFPTFTEMTDSHHQPMKIW